MSEAKDYQQVKASTLEALAKGDSETAFREFRWVIEHGSGHLDGTTGQFAEAFNVFAKISEHFANDEFVHLVKNSADDPNDIQALYDLGYVLYEESLFGIAATVLSRANDLAPNQPEIVGELAAAFQANDRNELAVELLQRNQRLVEQDPGFQYLLAFNAVMAGDLDVARWTNEGLVNRADTEDLKVMAARIAGFLARADQILSVCRLDTGDLRGWHYVTTGGILTTLSPFGYPEPMHGRFAFFNESYEVCRAGLQQLCRIIEVKSLRLPCVFALPDRNSRIVAHAIATVLDLPVHPWPTEGSNRPGLIAGYDLCESSIEVIQTLAEHQPDQLLFAHALNWTQSMNCAPDVATYMHQTVIEPWGADMRLDEKTQAMVTDEPDGRPVEAIAEQVANTTVTEELKGDEGVTVPQLTNALLDSLGRFPQSQGRRELFWANSPVKSSRFI